MLQTVNCRLALKFLAIMLLCMGALPSCEQRRAEQTSILPEQECEYLMAVVVDMSGSYAMQMQTDAGKAYRFLLLLVDRFFRDRIGSNDKIVIAQVSGAEKSLLWDGSPRALRQRFPNAEKFREFLLAGSDPMGSRVHDGVADTLDYIMGYPGVVNGETKSALFVMSDMDDNFPEAERSKARLLQSLTAYSRLGGVVGFYWVDQSLVPVWRDGLREAGSDRAVVESEIAEEPLIPTFEN